MMIKRNILSEIFRIKTLINPQLISEAVIPGFGKLIRMAIGNLDEFVRLYGENLRKPLIELQEAADDVTKMKKLREIGALNEEAAKQLRLKIFTRMSEATQTSIKDIIEYAESFPNEQIIDELNVALREYFPNMDSESRIFLMDLMRDKSSKIDYAFPKPQPKSTTTTKPPLTKTDKILQGLGLKNKPLEDQIRSKIKLYANKSNDELLKILKDYENDLIKNPTIKKQLDDIILNKGLKETWSELPFLRKIGIIIGLPVMGPAILSLLAALATLYINGYGLSWIMPMYRWVSTAGGTAINLKHLKNSAPECVKESIYKNEKGNIVIYISDTDELPIIYKPNPDKYYYKDGELEYELKNYCD